MPAARRRPRVLVTGFSGFPGVPENPTEALVAALGSRKAELAALGDVRCETLAVEYRPLRARLEALGAEWAPDVALHFGVSGRAKAFTLETLARNRVCLVKPDSSGHVPAEAPIRAEGADLATTLPVSAIMAALAQRGLPAALSDDAGDYLCNYLFYLSCGGHCPPFVPPMAGFVHVPPAGVAFDPATLTEGALVILRACCAAWEASPAGEKERAAPGAARPPRCGSMTPY